MLPPWFFRGTKFATRIGESSTFISFMVLLALFSIFSDDIRLSSFSKSADAGFEAATTAIFFVFLLEILMTCYYKEDYMTLPSMRKRSKEKGPTTWKSLIKRFKLGSFYFWLDLIAAFSLVVEVCTPCFRNSYSLCGIQPYTSLIDLSSYEIYFVLCADNSSYSMSCTMHHKILHNLFLLMYHVS